MSIGNSHIIQQIKDRADIVELISDHVVLKRSGSSYVGLCPFHSDNKPSMHVSPAKGIFKCFSCGAGGDVFKFWSEFHKKSFKETIKDLAQKYSIKLEFSQEEAAQAAEHNKQIKMHELAAKYYAGKLLGSDEAAHCRKYLEERHTSTATIETFQLGYAPANAGDWSKLTKYLVNEMSVSEKEIAEAGLAIPKKDGSGYFDRFRGRLMIPIHDDRGRVIAFGARALKDPQTGEEQMPKYLNSPETSIYHKGNHLYGLHLAKEFIRKEDRVIVVEGYFDVITAHQAGIKNIVANQGTALTPRQAKLLAKFSDSKKIYLCFDADKAGEDATQRGIETITQVASGSGAEVRIIRIPSGKDIDEMIKYGGVDAMRATIDKAPMIVDYQIDKIISKIDLNSPKEKGKAVSKLAEVLAMVSNHIERAEYTRIIADRLKVDEGSFSEQLKQEIRRFKNTHDNPYANLNPQTNNVQYDTSAPSKQKFIGKRRFTRVNGHILYIEDGISTTEKELVVLLLQDKELLEDFLSAGKNLISESYQKILEACSDISFENPDITDSNIKYQMLSDKLVAYPEYAPQLADIGIAIDIEKDKPEMERRYKDAVRKIDRHLLKVKMQEVVAKIKEIESQDSADVDDLWIQLQKEKQELVSQLQDS